MLSLTIKILCLLVSRNKNKSIQFKKYFHSFTSHFRNSDIPLNSPNCFNHLSIYCCVMCCTPYKCSLSDSVSHINKYYEEIQFLVTNQHLTVMKKNIFPVKCTLKRVNWGHCLYILQKLFLTVQKSTFQKNTSLGMIIMYFLFNDLLLQKLCDNFSFIVPLVV